MNSSDSSQPEKPTAINGVQIQSSIYGNVIPLVWGTTKISANVIWVDDFKKIAVPSSSGGK
jgi:hypothetical protein